MALGAGNPEQAAPPRRLPIVALLGAALVLVGIFTLILFPYGRFRDVAVAELSRATGASVSLGDLDGGLSVGGPSLRATNLLLRWPDGQEVLLDQARVRPAWSFSWLRGEPALHVRLRGPAGRVAGTVWPGLGPSFEGQAREVELELLPVEQIAAFLPTLGVVDAEFEIRTAATGPVGEIRFDARDGAIALPQIPFGIPYQEAHGDLERSESGSVVVRELELSGPMLSASVEGDIAASRSLEEGALDLQIDLLMVDPAMREMVQPYGIRLDADGVARLRVTGTLSYPVLAERP